MIEMKEQQSFTGKIWKFREKKIQTLEKLQASLLSHLKLSTPDDIQKFINPSLHDLRDPFLLENMDIAIERTLQAIENGERIMVAGDFDADGITATVVLVSALRECGAEVSYFIPDRTNDSHGLQKKFMDNFAEKKVKLVITCDCATNDHTEISHGKKLGIDTIVTDHHKMDPARFPSDAIAVINCQSSDNKSEQCLSGSAVAFKFASALLNNKFAQEPAKITEILDPLFEIATIGIISDCVPIVGDNRIIAKYGLAKMKDTSWHGLQTLIHKLNIQEIDEETIGFSIAPHLNAASRIGDVMIAVQLFLGNHLHNEERVDYLINLNRERRIATKEMISSAENQIVAGASCQLFFDKNWSQGIMGLAASHFAEKLNVPIIVGTIRSTDEMLSTSCRAPDGYSIIEGLENIGDMFNSYGGHAGAAGFIAEKNQRQDITKKMNTFFDQKEIKTPKITIDAIIDSEMLSLDLLEFLKFLAPFGAGNPAKIFALEQVKITHIKYMGKDRNHGKFTGKINNSEIECVAFFAETFLEKITIGDVIDILITVGENNWQGNTSLQLKLIDARKS